MSMNFMFCRSCKSSILYEVINLGTHYISGFYNQKQDDAPKIKMKLVQCNECKLVQLKDTPDQNFLYKKYWYRSNTNNFMICALNNIYNTAIEWAPKLKKNDVVLDIACNDMTLLANYDQEIVTTVGIDPSDIAREHEGCIACKHFVNDFFSEQTYRSAVGNRQAKIITSIAMLYDLPDPMKFVNDVYNCLSDDGIWIVQFSYTPLMIQQNAFDNICAEHLEYYTLQSLVYILYHTNFKIVDITLNDTNGGSCCIVITKKDNPLSHIPIFKRQIGEYRFNSYFRYEYNFNDREVWIEFFKRIVNLRENTINMLNSIKNEGKTIYGYGASTKGNTLLQTYNIGPDLITAIAEKQTQKVNKLTAGSWIPIISEAEMRSKKPDYLFIFPWHFKQSFLERENELLKYGTKFIFPLPELEVVGL